MHCSKSRPLMSALGLGRVKTLAEALTAYGSAIWLTAVMFCGLSAVSAPEWVFGGSGRLCNG